MITLVESDTYNERFLLVAENWTYKSFLPFGVPHRVTFVSEYIFGVKIFKAITSINMSVFSHRTF